MVLWATNLQFNQENLFSMLIVQLKSIPNVVHLSTVRNSRNGDRKSIKSSFHPLTSTSLMDKQILFLLFFLPVIELRQLLDQNSELEML